MPCMCRVCPLLAFVLDAVVGVVLVQPLGNEENSALVADTHVRPVSDGSDEDFLQASNGNENTPLVAWNDFGLAPNQNNAPVLTPDGAESFVDWNLCNVSVHSNLAGLGPDSGEKSIRYYGVGSAGGGQAFDLVVTASSNYVTNNNRANGLVGGDSCFGVVNVAGSSAVDLLFSLYLSGTNSSVALSDSYFTVYDLDNGKTSVEYYTIYQTVNNYYVVPNHTLDISGNLSSGLTLTFRATERGSGADNPKHPLGLSDAQQRRSVTVDFINKMQWKVTFGVEGGKGGRNFVFAGASNLVVSTTTTTTIFVKTTTSTTTGGNDKSTTTTTTCELQSCEIFADPHVSGFDNTENQGPSHLALIAGHDGGWASSARRSHTFDHRPVDVNAYDTGDFWLVKSEPVHIQGRFRYSGEFTPDMAAIGAVAVGGPFLNGSKFIVEPMDGTVTIDGKDLPEGDMMVRTVGGDVMVRQEGTDVEVQFPLNVKLLCKRFDKHIDVKITMPRLPGGMDGECGNFDGIAENDEEQNVLERMGEIRVEDNVLLFDTGFRFAVDTDGPEV